MAGIDRIRRNLIDEIAKYTAEIEAQNLLADDLAMRMSQEGYVFDIKDVDAHIALLTRNPNIEHLKSLYDKNIDVLAHYFVSFCMAVKDDAACIAYLTAFGNAAFYSERKDYNARRHALNVLDLKTLDLMADPQYDCHTTDPDILQSHIRIIRTSKDQEYYDRFLKANHQELTIRHKEALGWHLRNAIIDRYSH